MKAYQIRDQWSLENLQLVDLPEPVPGPGEVKTGTLPLIPVSDGVGIVKATGSGVKRVSEGDRVCPLFMQNWISGPPNSERLTHTLGGPIDGTMAEIRCFPENLRNSRNLDLHENYDFIKIIYLKSSVPV